MGDDVAAHADNVPGLRNGTGAVHLVQWAAPVDLRRRPADLFGDADLTIDELPSLCQPRGMASCPLCGGGKAKRQCPALGRAICPTCCGTKRLVEIACPPTCGWLRASRAHPPAAQLRQQDHDASLVVPLIRGLDDGAYAVLMACLPAAMACRSTMDPVPLDEDLQLAAAALAATAETAMRGVLYEHQPDSPVAARLARAMSAPLAEAAEAGVPRLDTSTAAAMRRLEEAIRGFRRSGDNAPDAYFSFLDRVLRPRVADAQTGQALEPGADPLLAPLAGVGGDDAPRIIIP